MKRLAPLLLLLCGCPDPNAAARLKTAADVGAYTVDLEVCITQAKLDKAAGVPESVWVPRARACYDVADAKHGRK